MFFCSGSETVSLWDARGGRFERVVFSWLAGAIAEQARDVVVIINDTLVEADFL